MIPIFAVIFLQLSQKEKVMLKQFAKEKMGSVNSPEKCALVRWVSVQLSIINGTQAARQDGKIGVDFDELSLFPDCSSLLWSVRKTHFLN